MLVLLIISILGVLSRTPSTSLFKCNDNVTALIELYPLFPTDIYLL